MDSPAGVAIKTICISDLSRTKSGVKYAILKLVDSFLIKYSFFAGQLDISDFLFLIIELYSMNVDTNRYTFEDYNLHISFV